jgi:hypothetical protein
MRPDIAQREGVRWKYICPECERRFPVKYLCNPWRPGDFQVQEGGKGIARANFMRHVEACRKRKDE